MNEWNVWHQMPGRGLCRPKVVAERATAAVDRLNFRWALRDGVLHLDQAGGEGLQWWLLQPEPVRGGCSAQACDRLPNAAAVAAHGA